MRLLAKLVAGSEHSSVVADDDPSRDGTFGLDCHDLSLDNVFVDEKDPGRIVSRAPCVGGSLLWLTFFADVHHRLGINYDQDHCGNAPTLPSLSAHFAVREQASSDVRSRHWRQEGFRVIRQHFHFSSEHVQRWGRRSCERGRKDATALPQPPQLRIPCVSVASLRASGRASRYAHKAAEWGRVGRGARWYDPREDEQEEEDEPAKSQGQFRGLGVGNGGIIRLMEPAAGSSTGASESEKKKKSEELLAVEMKRVCANLLHAGTSTAGHGRLGGRRVAHTRRGGGNNSTAGASTTSSRSRSGLLLLLLLLGLGATGRPPRRRARTRSTRRSRRRLQSSRRAGAPPPASVARSRTSCCQTGWRWCTAATNTTSRRVSPSLQLQLLPARSGGARATEARRVWTT